jgi:hypothetical protein
MHVVGHQAVRVHRAPKACCEKLKVVQVGKVIAHVEEARAAIVPALNDVHAEVGDHYARRTRHNAETAQQRWRLTAK